MKSAPGLQGYRMPAEWEPHRATWIAWPHHAADWPGKIGAVRWAYTEFVRHLSEGERVCILVQNAASERGAKGMLRRACVDLSRVEFHRVPTDRSWTRDSAPVFVRHRSGKRIATNWRFNGWAKYPNHKRDDKAADRIARAARVPQYVPRVGGRQVVLEGGAVDVDGQGTLLATEECLLSDVQARNPELGRAGTEKVLKETLGVRKVIWLGCGIAGDDTHGHVDDLARFVAPGKVLLCAEKNRKDENYGPLRENWERLAVARDARGRKLQIIPLPMPSPLHFDRFRLPASYANFYLGNGIVLVPTFNDPMDRKVLGLLSELFPKRKVVGIHAVDFVWGFGTLHCATQQEPL